MKLQEYLDKINNHIWENESLKSALTLATYINFGLLEYGESSGINININLESIINAVIDSDIL